MSRHRSRRPARSRHGARGRFQAGDAQLEVLAQGSGPTVVMLPSLGRGASDFDAIADRMVEAGFRVLRPQPRGIGKSTGPWQGVEARRPRGRYRGGDRAGQQRAGLRGRPRLRQPRGRGCSRPLDRIWSAP